MLIHKDLTHSQLTYSLTPTFTVGWNSLFVNEGVCQNQHRQRTGYLKDLNLTVLLKVKISGPYRSEEIGA